LSSFWDYTLKGDNFFMKTAHMHKVLFILISLLFPLHSAADEPAFLFAKFTPASIYFLDGTFAKADMNFELATGKMIYILDGEYMEMTSENKATRVEFEGGRVFFQREPEKFYERIHLEHGDVFVFWKINKVNVGNKGAYGVTTQASVSGVRLTTLPGGGNIAGNYDTYIDAPVYEKEVYRQKADNTYMFSVKDKEYKVKTLKNVYKKFSSQEERIRKFVEERKLSMNNAEEALQIVDFILGL